MYLWMQFYVSLEQHSMIGKKKGDEFSILVLKHPNWIKQENNLLEPKFFYCLVWRNFVIGKMWEL